jgi:hypothetical protein
MRMRRCVDCGGYESPRNLEYGLCPRCLKLADERADEMEAIGKSILGDEIEDEEEADPLDELALRREQKRKEAEHAEAVEKLLAVVEKLPEEYREKIARLAEEMSVKEQEEHQQ